MSNNNNIQLEKIHTSKSLLHNDNNQKLTGVKRSISQVSPTYHTPPNIVNETIKLQPQHKKQKLVNTGLDSTLNKLGTFELPYIIQKIQ